MRALLQRVLSASVLINDQQIASIDRGLLVYVGLDKSDETLNLKRMAERILSYRLFADEADKMNLNVKQCNADILVVSQFTLAANTEKGNRPSFTPAMPPELAKQCFADFLERLKNAYPKVVSGQFQADMQVHSVNDGPVTFMLST